MACLSVASVARGLRPDTHSARAGFRQPWGVSAGTGVLCRFRIERLRAGITFDLASGNVASVEALRR